MRHIRQALVQGLALPLRFYFQPGAAMDQVGRRDARADPKPPPLLVYACSLIWLPISILAGTLIFGLPRQNALLMLVGIPLALAALGAAAGVMQLYVNNVYAGLVFDYATAEAVGVVFAVAVVFDALALDVIATQNNIGIAQVVDSPTLDLPTMFILGAGMGMAMNVIFGGRAGARKVVMFGLPIGAGMLSLFALGPNPAVRMGNIAFGITAVLLATHLIFQPLYVIAAVISRLLVGVNSEWSRGLWRISPANWNEFSYVPLPGLGTLLRALWRTDPAVGLEAIDRLAHHPFYASVGERLAGETGKA